MRIEVELIELSGAGYIPAKDNGWQRDLMRECVEPNPGPSALDVLELFAKKAGVPSSDPRIEGLLNYIKTKAEFPNSDDVDCVTLDVLKTCFPGVSDKGLENLSLFLNEARSHFKAQAIPPVPSNSSSAPDTELTYEGAIVLKCDFSDFGELIEQLSKQLKINSELTVPQVEPFTPKFNEYLRDDLPSVNGILNLLLLKGHLGDEEELSDEANQILEAFEESKRANNYNVVRIRGPSGSGKTKVIHDVLREIFGIYIDWNSIADDVFVFIERLSKYREFYPGNTLEGQQQFENACKYELQLLYTGRVMVLAMLLQSKVITGTDAPILWMLMQQNGITRHKYSAVLRPVRDFLRSICGSDAALWAMFTDASLFIEQYTAEWLAYKCNIVIALDETNVLVRKMENQFWDVDRAHMNRTLLSFVLRTTYHYSRAEVIASGTTTIADHAEYFGSLLVKPTSQIKRVSVDINMKCLHLFQSLRLLSYLTRNLPISLRMTIAMDGTRCRFITTYAETLGLHKIYDININVNDPREIYETYRKFLVEGVPTEFNSMTLFHQVTKFVQVMGCQALVNMALQQIHLTSFTLADTDKDIMNSNLVFITLDNNQEVCTMTESIVVDSVLYFLKKRESDTSKLYMPTLGQITSGGISPQEVGHKLEYLLGIYYASTEVTLRLPNNLKFHISTTSTDLREQLQFADWVDNPCIAMPSTQLGMDLSLPLTVNTPEILYDLFETANRDREWQCFGVIACKTSQRDGRTVDEREVAQAQRTTSFEHIYTTREYKERETHIISKLASLEKLYNRSTQANILFVRYHVCLPAPSKNAIGTRTPKPTDVWRRVVTVNFCSTENASLSFLYYDLTVTVDIESAQELLGLDDTITKGLKKIWDAKPDSSNFPVQYCDVTQTLYTYKQPEHTDQIQPPPTKKTRRTKQ